MSGKGGNRGGGCSFGGEEEGREMKKGTQRLNQIKKEQIQVKRVREAGGRPIIHSAGDGETY